MRHNITQMFYLTVFGLVVYSAQSFIIFPLEEFLRGDGSADYASLLFLPHGFKAFAVIFFGIVAFVPIFICQFANGLFFYGEFKLDAFISTLIGLISFVIPYALYNLSKNKNIFTPRKRLFDKDVSNFWLFCQISIYASFVNSLLHSSYYATSEINLKWNFLLGDNIGALAFFTLCLFVLAPVIKKTMEPRNEEH